jgi:hypothetical protein
MAEPDDLPPLRVGGKLIQLEDLHFNDFQVLLLSGTTTRHWPPSDQVLEVTPEVRDTLAELFEELKRHPDLGYVRELGEGEVRQWKMELNAARSHGRHP